MMPRTELFLCAVLLTSLPAGAPAQSLPGGMQPAPVRSLACPKTGPVQRFSVPPDSLGAFVACWFTQQLDSLGERDLWSVRRGPDTLIRFLWLRTFDRPVAVRVAGHGTQWEAIISVADGKGGYDPGHLVRKDTVPLGRSQVDSLLGLLSLARFWTTPTLDPQPGNDGAQWVFELLAGTRYVVRQRWSPKEGDPYRVVGVQMLRLLRDTSVTSPLY